MDYIFTPQYCGGQRVVSTGLRKFITHHWHYIWRYNGTKCFPVSGSKVEPIFLMRPPSPSSELRMSCFCSGFNIVVLCFLASLGIALLREADSGFTDTVGFFISITREGRNLRRLRIRLSPSHEAFLGRRLLPRPLQEFPARLA